MWIVISGIRVRLLLIMLGVGLLTAVSVHAGEEACLLAWMNGEDAAAEIYVWDSTTGDINNISQNPTGNFNPIWSADGKLAWLTYVSGAFHLSWTLVSEIRVWDSATGEVSTISEDTPGIHQDLRWSNDGRLAWSAAGRNSGDVYVWDSTTDEVTNVSNGWNTVEISLTFSPDGWLAWMSGPGESCSWQIYALRPTGRAPVNVSQNRVCNLRPSWSHDGRLAWISNQEGDFEIYVWDSATGETIRVGGNSSPVDSALLWSNDGRLAWRSGDIYVWDSTTDEIINVTHGEGCAEHFAWSSDGKLTWTGCDYNGMDIFVLDSVGGSPINISQNPSQYYGGPSWSSDGRLAWASGENGNAEIYIWDSATGEVINLTNSPTLDRNPVWSPVC